MQGEVKLLGYSIGYSRFSDHQLAMSDEVFEVSLITLDLA